MQFFKCSSKVTIITENVHCPQCDKYYNVCSLEHICNREMSCTKRDDPPEITNVTIYAVPADIDYVHQVCLGCKEAERRANAPTYNKCAKCGYHGWYKPDTATGYCSSCTVSVDIPECIPDVALPSAPAPAVLREHRPIGKIVVDTTIDRSITLYAYSDTTKIYDAADDWCDVRMRGNLSEFITEVIDHKNKFESIYPGIIWVDIPTSLRMFLEDSADDAGLSVTF